MRILFDIVHPADVLFFLAPLRLLQRKNAQTLILSRHKDVTCQLLDHFGLSHIPVSAAGTGRLGLARELIARDWRVLRAARHFRPDAMVGLGGVSISHAGRLLGIPSISFYAADTATLQTRITWPFIDHLYVPAAYAGPVPDGRTKRFSGIKELSYFHPDQFQVDEGLARANGWDPEKENFFIRTVSWRANHDLGKAGWCDDTLGGVVDMLVRRGRVHISSERPLPPHLRRYEYTGRPHEIHQVMAKCRLYVGESATMAHEAAMLGVPAIYDGRDHPGTTRELAAAGMVCALRQPPAPILQAAVSAMLAPEIPAHVAGARDAYLAANPNLAAYIADEVEAIARGSGKRAS